MSGTGAKRAFSSRGYLTRMTSRRNKVERKPELTLEDLKKISEMLNSYSVAVTTGGGWFDHEESAVQEKLDKVIESRSRRGKLPSPKFKKKVKTR